MKTFKKLTAVFLLLCTVSVTAQSKIAHIDSQSLN